MERYTAVCEEWDHHGRYDTESETEAVLRGLGLRADDLERDCGELSGGWQMRVALAQLLLRRPDILLLDEPTNYLDLEARNWLEEFLAAYAGTIIMVAHDRYFLDVTVDHIAEVLHGRVTDYPMTYSRYLEERETRLELARQAYEGQKAEIERVEAFVHRFRYQASKAALVQSRVKQLEKIERLPPPDGHGRSRPARPRPPRRLPLLGRRRRQARGRPLRRRAEPPCPRQAPPRARQLPPPRRAHEPPRPDREGGPPGSPARLRRHARHRRPRPLPPRPPPHPGHRGRHRPRRPLPRQLRGLPRLQSPPPDQQHPAARGEADPHCPRAVDALRTAAGERVRPAYKAGRGRRRADPAAPARARSFGGTLRPTSRAWSEDREARRRPLPAAPRSPSPAAAPRRPARRP